MPVMYKGESVAIVSLWIVKWLFSWPFTRNGTRYIVDFEDVQKFLKTKFAKTAVNWCCSKFYAAVERDGMPFWMRVVSTATVP